MAGWQQQELSETGRRTLREIDGKPQEQRGRRHPKLAIPRTLVHTGAQLDK